LAAMLLALYGAPCQPGGHPYVGEGHVLAAGFRQAPTDRHAAPGGAPEHHHCHVEPPLAVAQVGQTGPVCAAQVTVAFAPLPSPYGRYRVSVRAVAGRRRCRRSRSAGRVDGRGVAHAQA
jgi:hypothetical protein